MEDKWVTLKQAEGDRQTVYLRLDAISGIASAGLGTKIWVHGAPLLVEEKPPQVLQKMKAAKPLFAAQKGEGPVKV